MKVKVINRTQNELKIEIEGSGHGLCNLLQKKILEEKDVDIAGYDVPHPLASNPVIFIRVKGDASPEKVLIEAAKKASQSNNDFSKELEKALNS
jgi:DNA-directed RNA polymerase subunit L